MKSLRSTIIGGEESASIDATSDVSNILSTVSDLRAANANQRSRLDEMKCGLRSLRSTIIHGEETDSFDPMSAFSDLSAVLSDLRDDNALLRSRICELERAIRSLRYLILGGASKTLAAPGLISRGSPGSDLSVPGLGFDDSIEVDDISSSFCSLRADNDVKTARVVELESALGAIRFEVLGIALNDELVASTVMNDVISAFSGLRAANLEEKERNMSLQSGLQALRSSMVSTTAEDSDSEADDLSCDVGQISSNVDSLRRNTAASRASIGELANALACVRAVIDPGGSEVAADLGLDSLDRPRISSTVSLLREDNATIRLHNEELKQGLESLRSLIVSDDGVQPVDCESTVEDIVSAYICLREDHAARGARIRELEGSVRILQSSVLDTDAEELGCGSNITLASSMVVSLQAENHGQPSRIDELEAAFVSLRSSIVGGDDSEPVNCATDVGHISSAVSALREASEKQNARILELENALKSLLTSVLADHSPDCLSVDTLNPSVVCSSISSEVTSLRKEVAHHKSRIVVLENAFRALRFQILGRSSGEFDVDRPIDTDVELHDLSAAINRLRKRIETQLAQLREWKDSIKMLNDNIMELAGIEPGSGENSEDINVGTISNVVAQLREANTTILARSAELEGVLRVAQKENTSRAKRLSQMEEAIKTLRKDNLGRVMKVVELQSLLKSAQQESTDRAKRVSDLQAVRKQLEKESADQLSRVRELEARLRSAEQENTSRGLQLSQLESALQSLYSRLITGLGTEIPFDDAAPGPALCDKISSAVDTLRDQNHTQQLRISELESAMKSLRSAIIGGDEAAPVSCELCTASIVSTVASLREDMAACHSRASELELAMKSLRFTSSHPTSGVSNISDSVSNLQSRVLELESGMKSLRSTIVGGDESASIDATSDVSNILSTVSDLRAANANQGSRLDELESAMKSLLSTLPPEPDPQSFNPT
jgi:uncharacterized protein YlxW (UPF0749 family)